MICIKNRRFIWLTTVAQQEKNILGVWQLNEYDISRSVVNNWCRMSVFYSTKHDEYLAAKKHLEGPVPQEQGRTFKQSNSYLPVSVGCLNVGMFLNVHKAWIMWKACPSWQLNTLLGVTRNSWNITLYHLYLLISLHVVNPNSACKVWLVHWSLSLFYSIDKKIKLNVSTDHKKITKTAIRNFIWDQPRLRQWVRPL